MQEKTCCVFGHREIDETAELRAQVTREMERLITEEKVDTFLFGSKSRFNDLCLALVTQLKEQYPHIKRVYLRAEFPHIDQDYMAYLLQSYEDTEYPEGLLGAGKAVYVERNYEMIRRSRFCIVYYKEEYSPSTRKSGTKTALDYARKKGREIISFP